MRIKLDCSKKEPSDTRCKMTTLQSRISPYTPPKNNWKTIVISELLKRQRTSRSIIPLSSKSPWNIPLQPFIRKGSANMNHWSENGIWWNEEPHCPYLWVHILWQYKMKIWFLKAQLNSFSTCKIILLFTELQLSK